jgi:hypothetical protein
MPSNSGKALDSAGNIQVDFVWGNFPRQPNDVRTLSTDTNVAQDGTSKRLLKGKDNHDTVYSGYAGYPSFSTGVKDINNQYQGDAGKNTISLGTVAATTTATQASVGSYTVVVASAAGIAVGQGVASTGYIPTGAFVTSVSGTTIGISLPTIAAMSTTAITFGTDGTWTYTPNIVVPQALGLNGTATDITSTGTGAVTLGAYGAQDGLRDNGYTSTITVGTAVTNTALAVSAIARTAGTNTVTVTTATHTYAAGQAVQILGANATTEFVNNFYTIASVPNNTSITFTTTATTAVALSALTGVTIKGVTGSVATQSVAANANGIDGTAGITIALWA